MKILIIEKDLWMIDTYRKYLEHRNCSVITAANELAAIGLLHEHQNITAVILDTNFSEMEEMELLQLINNTHNIYKRHPDVFLISIETELVLRSHLEAQNISRHRITGVLNKPVDLNALYNSLNI